jgi:hypothetical protein
LHVKTSKYYLCVKQKHFLGQIVTLSIDIQDQIQIIVLNYLVLQFITIEEDYIVVCYRSQKYTICINNILMLELSKRDS